jgi:hypothetical protein
MRRLKPTYRDLLGLKRFFVGSNQPDCSSNFVPMEEGF